LVCSGVAPDHLKIKSISKQFEKIAEDPRFSFFGNVVVGEHIEATALAEHYDAVKCGRGAMGSGTETFRRGPAGTHFQTRRRPVGRPCRRRRQRRARRRANSGPIPACSRSRYRGSTLYSLCPCSVEEMVIIGRRGRCGPRAAP
jgi:hypothetical protein